MAWRPRIRSQNLFKIFKTLANWLLGFEELGVKEMTGYLSSDSLSGSYLHKLRVRHYLGHVEHVQYGFPALGSNEALPAQHSHAPPCTAAAFV